MVEEGFGIVMQAIKKISSSVDGVLVGSYRRQMVIFLRLIFNKVNFCQERIGDIDILLYGPSIKQASETLEMALDALSNDGFLTHRLSKEDLEYNGRFMGICMLENLHRRLGKHSFL